MFQISAYTVFLDDTPETGRTKINYLFTGGASPFFIWSGTTENVKQISLFKLDENYSNQIFSLQGLESGRTIYNFIINGLNNVIDTSTKSLANGDGGYNLINGINNKINTYGSGNTISGSGNTMINSFNSFSHGINNRIISLQLNLLNVFSSKNSFIGGVGFGSFFSSKNLGGQSTSASPNNFKILSSGVGNKIQNSSNNSNASIWNSFITNGNNNKILLNSNFSNSASFHGIINGQSNTINISNSVNNNYLFGSNLTAVSTGNSQFQNLYVDESLLVKNVKKYTVNSPSTQNITINTEYSFHEVYDVDQPVIKIHIPNSNKDLQTLSICISGGTSPTPLLLFTDSAFGTFPSNISCKQGILNRYTAGGPDAGTAVAYFFMWTNKINKWVMFNADSSITSFF